MGKMIKKYYTSPAEMPSRVKNFIKYSPALYQSMIDEWVDKIEHLEQTQVDNPTQSRQEIIDGLKVNVSKLERLRIDGLFSTNETLARDAVELDVPKYYEHQTKELQEELNDLLELKQLYPEENNQKLDEAIEQKRRFLTSAHKKAKGITTKFVVMETTTSRFI